MRNHTQLCADLGEQVRRTFAGFNTVTGPTYDSTITFSYDAGDRLTSVVDSVAGTITPTFDNLDRLTEEQTSQGTVDYTYDAAGRRTSMTVAGQTAVDYSYDNANRLTGMTQGTSTSVSFGYDNANKRTSLTLPNGIVVSYGYDSASQLTGLTYTNGSTTLGNLIYSYDLAGRRTSMGGSLAQQELPSAISTTAYNANNQLTTWGTASLYYDANGNMTSDGTNSYVWDARNHLASMNLGGETFEYDGYGRRVGKTTIGGTTNYLYDGINPVQELSGTTVTANLLTGLGVDERFTRTDSSGTANFLTDALGSTITLTNSSGSTLASYAYEPFGNTTVTSGTSASPYQYTGQVNDGTGVYFYRNRYYSPTLQRFISEDPLGDVNLYEYARNNPVRNTDPLGLWTLSLGVSVNIQAGPINLQFSGAAVFDSQGNFGSFVQGGGGAGAGTEISGGGSVQLSNANTIGDLGGWFVNASQGGGDGVGRSIDQFHGFSPLTGAPVSGSGITFGPTAGGGVSDAATYTRVFPVFPICSANCGPGPAPEPSGPSQSPAGRKN